MIVREGGCHRGAGRFRVRTTSDEPLDGNRSLGAKKGYLRPIVTRDAFELVAGEAALADGSIR